MRPFVSSIHTKYNSKVTGAFMSQKDNPNHVHMSQGRKLFVFQNFLWIFRWNSHGCIRSRTKRSSRDGPRSLCWRNLRSCSGLDLFIFQLEFSQSKCGCKTIEHASFIDERAIKLIHQKEQEEKKNIFIVPTLFISEYFRSQGDAEGPLSKMIELEKKYFKLNQFSDLRAKQDSW